MISVLIVDDHLMVGEGIGKFLSRIKDINVVGIARNSQAALQALNKEKPDIILLDIDLIAENGIDSIPQISSKAPSTKILVWSMCEDPSFVINAIAAGASGYIDKSDAIGTLVAALRTIAEGRTYFCENTKRILDALLLSPSDDSPAKKNILSTRERQVVEMRAKGLTFQEIGKELGINYGTVRIYWGHAVGKLGLACIQHSRYVAI